MSYSRWSNSIWYTYWRLQPNGTEDRDNATFEICALRSFNASELRYDIEWCLQNINRNKDFTDDQMLELKGYMLKFLFDVESEYL